MTRISEFLGAEYDAPAKLPQRLVDNDEKRMIALAALQRAEAAGDAVIAELMQWELGILDLLLAPPDGVSPYRGKPYEAYAQFYRFTPSTPDYARERANETRDLILKIHYLTFFLLRMEPRGRAWVELQREILSTYLEHIDACLSGSIDDEPAFHLGHYLSSALTQIGLLISRPGVVLKELQPCWAHWILDLAKRALSFQVKDPDWAQIMQYQWATDYLKRLTALGPEAASSELRERTLAILRDAAAFYESIPLVDEFSHRVAETEATIRKHWGETGTHERMIRQMFAATLLRAEFFQKAGSGFITAHAFRQARRLVEEQRQYFSAADIARLQRAEQAALEHGVKAGELFTLIASTDFPMASMNFTRESPEATVTKLFEQVVGSLPVLQEIYEQERSRSVGVQLISEVNRVAIGPGKVVGESTTEQKNLALDVEAHAVSLACLTGGAVATTAICAAKSVGLTAEHLVAPIAALSLDEGALALIRHGCERLVEQDFISATHVLALRFEDALRQHLRSIGVNTTEFKVLDDGTSRTDDATLGALLAQSLPSGQLVKDYLGVDFWEHINSTLNSQTGLNLRNNIAHGQIRPRHCTADTAGIALALLYHLTSVAQRKSSAVLSRD